MSTNPPPPKKIDKVPPPERMKRIVALPPSNDNITQAQKCPPVFIPLVSSEALHKKLLSLEIPFNIPKLQKLILSLLRTSLLNLDAPKILELKGK